MTMASKKLEKALATRGELSRLMATDGGDCESVLAQFAEVGVNVEELAIRRQEERAALFAKSWNDMLVVLSTKGHART